jgi:glycosyltransferase involved in cell wall biosynthesis
VHDLAWARYPETYATADLRMQQRAVPRAVLHAARVIAVSASTARDLVAMLGVPEGKVTVIHLGVSPRFSPNGPLLPKDAFPGADRLRNGYLLYAGGLQPRKNLTRLLEAYSTVRRRIPVPPLVLAGGRSPHAEELAERARQMEIAGAVMFPGHVREDLLPALYRSAALFVYPSLYEGFGLPVLEAMASRTPVVTSDRSGMAEVGGDAALLVDPESVEQLTSALQRLLAEPDLRRALAERGLARSRRFSWHNAAQQTAALYQRVLRDR